jgi:hypothetical protein
MQNIKNIPFLICGSNAYHLGLIKFSNLPICNHDKCKNYINHCEEIQNSNSVDWL